MPPGPNSPVIIVGPTTRCGTTLLQRLLNSTRDYIIYGENFYMFDRFPAMIQGQHMDAEQKHQATKAVRETFLNSDDDFEGSSLFPDRFQYLAAVRAGFHHLVKFYADYSRDLGFESWGIKHQIFNAQGYAFLTKLLPEAYYICIYRDLYPVTRSAKARWPGDYPNLAAYTRFGQRWMENINAIHKLQPKHKLIFKYENMVADTDGHIDQLQNFLGTDRINRAVMDRKINTQPKVASGNQHHFVDPGYVKPADLEAAETTALFKNCNDFYRQLGYDRSQHLAPDQPNRPDQKELL